MACSYSLLMSIRRWKPFTYSIMYSVGLILPTSKLVNGSIQVKLVVLLTCLESAHNGCIMPSVCMDIQKLTIIRQVAACPMGLGSKIQQTMHGAESQAGRVVMKRTMFPVLTGLKCVLINQKTMALHCNPLRCLSFFFTAQGYWLYWVTCFVWLYTSGIYYCPAEKAFWDSTTWCTIPLSYMVILLTPDFSSKILIPPNETVRNIFCLWSPFERAAATIPCCEKTKQFIFKVL